MGIEVDVDARRITVPQNKLVQVLDLCRAYVHKKWLSKKQFHSVLGKLLYIHRCVAPARVFINRLLNMFRGIQGRIKVCSEIKKDLNWFIHFLHQFNGIVMFDDTSPNLQVL